MRTSTSAGPTPAMAKARGPGDRARRRGEVGHLGDPHVVGAGRRAEDVDRRLAQRPGARRAGHDERAGAVGHQAAVEEVQRAHLQRRGEHVVDRERVAVAGARVQRGPLARLHRDGGQLLRCRSEIVHVARSRPGRRGPWGGGARRGAPTRPWGWAPACRAGPRAGAGGRGRCAGWRRRRSPRRRTPPPRWRPPRARRGPRSSSRRSWWTRRRSGAARDTRRRPRRDSGWQTPSTSASVSPASASASSTMATSSSRPVRSSSPVGETSSATPTIAAAPRRLRSSRLTLATPRPNRPSPTQPSAAQAFLGSCAKGVTRSLLGSLGSPSTRSPMMLRWTWSVPP